MGILKDDEDDDGFSTFLLWLLIFLIFTAGAALIGLKFFPGEWYFDLEKPSWTPPDNLFAPVWTGLYVAIAIAGCLVWTTSKAALANLFWFAQLLANGVWPWLFFGQQRIDLALVCIIGLLLLIAGFIRTAWRVHRLAAVLFVPYFLWVAFSAALNAAIWQLNGMAIGGVVP